MSNDLDQWEDDKGNIWQIVRDKETNKVLYAYNKTDLEHRQKHLQPLTHLMVDPVMFNKILEKNTKIMNGEICSNCECDPCECS